MGVDILHYHADNGRFADNLFMEHVRKSGQTISFCAVGAHFQNGRAEKKIRDLRATARKMLLHAMSRWSDTITINLWPYALRTACDQMNMIPKDIQGITRIEMFSGVPVTTRLKNFNTWGCPVYALHSKLQGNISGVPKWNPRARLGINLGFSPRHARTVSLVLNIDTGLVSPQFHVIHDNFFETLKPDLGNVHRKKSNWQYLAGFKKMSTKLNVDKSESKNVQLPPYRTVENEKTENQEINDIPDSQADPDPNTPTGSYINEDGLRRSSRINLSSKAVSEFNDSYDAYYDAMHQEDYKIQDKMKDPISFAASSDPDTLYWHQAMKQPDAEEFRKAAIKEFNDHCEKKHWVIIDRSEVPPGKNVLPAVWSMKRKRNILTRKVIKYKARLNIHGGKQVFGEDYNETYSPVVSWMTIRFFLILSLICGWKTKQIYFVLAFPQANIEQDMYMELPTGIIPKDPNKDYVLFLRKNLYGQKQASRVFFLYLKEGLEKIGFQQSDIDECLFYRDKTMFLIYVDDGIFIDSDESNIAKAVKELMDLDYKIEEKGNLSDYLGINFKQVDDKTVELTQPQLIDQIINDTKVMAKKFKCPPTPAKSSQILHRYKDRPSFDKKWHYRSVIGKLNYLEKSTRPDIAYAVHQCARFSEDPKVEHAQAVEHLVKYLAGTKDKGIIISPKGDPIIEIYADADFCGNWNKLTAPNDASTAKSRTGYLIMFAKCQVTWTSKLQTQIALSTTEAEYMALSQSLRDGIPLMQLVQELVQKKIMILPQNTQVYCKCFEDNSGALELASNPKLRPRTKHINIIYHHFREYVRKGLVKVHPITTDEQIADLFTKPLSQNMFVKLRKKVMNW